MATPAQSLGNAIPPMFVNSTKEGYAAAKSTIGAGTFIKVITVIVALLMLLVGVAMAADGNPLESQEGVALLMLGVVLAFAGYCAGVVVGALGQILRAVLDTSVNTLSSGDAVSKAEVMGVVEPAPAQST